METVGPELLELKPLGPDHDQVGLGALVLVVSCTALAAQVKLPPAAVSVGGVIFPVMTMVSAATHCIPPPFMLAVRM